MSIADPRRVLVLQGGGALGAYQAGVYQALGAAGQQPQWVAGISIGALNAALIAGNPPERRVERLTEFWNLVTSALSAGAAGKLDELRAVQADASIGWAVATGVPGFFTLRVISPLFAAGGSPDTVSFYDTAPLRATLERLVDFEPDQCAGDPPRASGPVKHPHPAAVRLLFDNTKQRIGPEHIMASGALPPGLPPIEIDGEWYWDGGLVSNTPLEYVLEQDDQDDLTIYQIDLFNARGPLPRTIQEAAEREKDIRFSSRTRANTDSQLRIHQLKAALGALLEAPARRISPMTRRSTS